MRYIILYWDPSNGRDTRWEVYWRGTEKKTAVQKYRRACKEFPIVELQKTQTLEEQDLT